MTTNDVHLLLRGLMTRGSAEIGVAVLDGPVDLTHPCFEGARIERSPALSPPAPAEGKMAAHGTHVASVLFGQPGSPVEGVAPGCRGVVIPVFAEGGLLSQMDLARAINQAVEARVQIINVSGGQRVEGGQADPLLEKAIRFAADRNVLVVAAAGNDGCRCLHVPAALRAVLGVGAMDEEGRPLDISNWGYEGRAILAPGAGILGARPGGGVSRATGTSFAAPIVAGVAALLLSLQVERGQKPDPGAVREALLRSALPCEGDADRCLAGRLNVLGAMKLTRSQGDTMSETIEHQTNAVQPSGCACGGAAPATDDEETRPEASSPVKVAPSAHRPKPAAPGARAGVTPSEASSGGLVYSLGTLGYDFATEARRDSFKQLMPAVTFDGVAVPANPYDARQMVDYLKENLSEAKALVWTLNLELTPIYALEPEGPFSREVYQVLQRLLDGQVRAESDKGWIERVSIPGRLTGRRARLFSGQVVPVVSVDATRGLYGWNVNTLQDAAIAAVKKGLPDAKEEAARKALESFLYKVYYQLRNLGQSSQERALNFAATNAFQVASTFSEAVGTGMELDDIQVQKSPFCRMDSDCWDVSLSFFDPENLMRARRFFQFTIDVSDIIPVTLGEVRSWSSR